MNYDIYHINLLFAILDMLDLKELNLANFISSTLYHVLTVTHNEMRDKLKKKYTCQNFLETMIWNGFASGCDPN